MESFLHRKTREQLTRDIDARLAELSPAAASGSGFNLVVTGGSLCIGEGSNVRRCKVLLGVTVKIGSRCTVVGCNFTVDTEIGDDCTLIQTNTYRSMDKRQQQKVVVLSGSRLSDCGITAFSCVGGSMSHCTMQSAAVAAGSLCVDSGINYARIGKNALLYRSTVGSDNEFYNEQDQRTNGTIIAGDGILLLRSCVLRASVWKEPARAWSIAIGSDAVLKDVRMDFSGTLHARIGDRLRVASSPRWPEDSPRLTGQRANQLCLAGRYMSLGDDVSLQLPGPSSGYIASAYVTSYFERLVAGTGTRILCTGSVNLPGCTIRATGGRLVL